MEQITWHTEKRAVRELKPNPRNPRTVSESSLKKLRDSLTKFGLAEIPAINTDNTILAGHQRVRLLDPDEQIDVRVPNRYLEWEEQQEYLVRSNRSAGDWDFDELANTFDMDMLLDVGFTHIELGLNIDKLPPMNLAETISFDMTEAQAEFALGALSQIKAEHNFDTNTEALLWTLQRILS